MDIGPSLHLPCSQRSLNSSQHQEVYQRGGSLARSVPLGVTTRSARAALPTAGIIRRTFAALFRAGEKQLEGRFIAFRPRCSYSLASRAPPAPVGCPPAPSAQPLVSHRPHAPP